LQALWWFVTDFGDSAVTLPLALLAFGFLVGAGERRIALSWVLAIGGCAVAIGVLKLGFGACGERIPLGHIVSPSGHTAMSTAIYGSLALLAGARLPPGRRRALHAAAAFAVIAIAMSRAVLHEHDVAEIVLGGIVGAGAVMFFHRALRREKPPALRLAWLLACGAGLVAVMHGTRWMIEPVAQRLAWDLRLILPWCR
jgi:membrane-associated phospholipid phosphatase